MRREIEKAIRNANLIKSNKAIEILLATRIDELTAIETDRGLDAEGTIVNWYTRIYNLTDLYSVPDEETEENTIVAIQNTKWAIARINEEIEQMNVRDYTQLNQTARLTAVNNIFYDLLDEERKEAEEEEREPMPWNKLHEIAHSLALENVYSFDGHGRIVKN